MGVPRRFSRNTTKRSMVKRKGRRTKTPINCFGLSDTPYPTAPLFPYLNALHVQATLSPIAYTLNTQEHPIEAIVLLTYNSPSAIVLFDSSFAFFAYGLSFAHWLSYIYTPKKNSLSWVTIIHQFLQFPQ